MSEKLIVDDEEWDADDCRNMKRTADQMTIWKRERDKRIEELERVLRRIVLAECDVERESALVEARHVLDGR